MPTDFLKRSSRSDGAGHCKETDLWRLCGFRFREPKGRGGGHPYPANDETHSAQRAPGVVAVDVALPDLPVSWTYAV